MCRTRSCRISSLQRNRCRNILRIQIKARGRPTCSPSFYLDEPIFPPSGGFGEAKFISVDIEYTQSNQHEGQDYKENNIENYRGGAALARIRCRTTLTTATSTYIPKIFTFCFSSLKIFFYKKMG